MKGVIAEIDAMTAMRFVLPRHYSGRRPTISRAFGWYRNKSINYSDLVAVCTFGKPATPSLCTGICGEQYAQNVYELNRLCRSEDWNEQLSQFVSACLRRLRTSDWIVVSYSDTAMHHHGYIYQACNFLYTGCTAERTDKFVGGGRHSRHYKNSQQTGQRLVRSAKHRYVFFCTFNRKLKEQWRRELRYPVLPYPKGDNDPDYAPGYILQPNIVPDKRYKPTQPDENAGEDKSGQFSLF